MKYVRGTPSLMQLFTDGGVSGIRLFGHNQGCLSAGETIIVQANIRFRRDILKESQAMDIF